MKYNDLIPELIVSDIEKSKEFYIELLRFKIEYEREEDKFVFLFLNEIQLMLEQGSNEELKEMIYPFGKGVNFSFGMDNVEEVYKNFKEINYPIKSELKTMSFRVDDSKVTQKEFSIYDPDGYFIRITT